MNRKRSGALCLHLKGAGTLCIGHPDLGSSPRVSDLALDS